MGWDSSRPVPWQRMMREWLLYVAIMLVILVIFFRDQSLIGIVAGLLVSGPLYLAFGYVFAKFGYRRKSWKELRDESARDARGTSKRTMSSSDADDAADAPPRPKPAPTKRTGGSSNRPGGNRKRR